MASRCSVRWALRSRKLRAMSSHHIVAADVHRVPAPFRSFAVRSDEPGHAWAARAPYRRVHRVSTTFLDAIALASLSTAGYSRVSIEFFSDIDYANTTLADLATAAPGVVDLGGQIAVALQMTGVLGKDPAAYRASVAARIDYLACCGAGFHNDVSRHWSRCLFWVLALDAADVEFVMPHAGVRQSLCRATCWCSTRPWRTACVAQAIRARPWRLLSKTSGLAASFF